MKASVLKPGLLVSLKTSVKGAVNYERKEIEQEHVNEEGAKVARWETAREIPDPAEFERASKARNDARSKIAGVCNWSSFGLLCPAEREGDLQDAVIEARQIADRFNDTAERAKVEVFVLVGRVAQDDVEAARAIGSEMRELLELMKAGIAAADPEAVRHAANRARSVSGMLSQDAAKRATDAIEEARRAARELAKRVVRGGEDAAQVIADCATKAIEAARFAFLDLENSGEVTTDAPAARTVELDAPEPSAPQQAAAPQLELGGLS